LINASSHLHITPFATTASLLPVRRCGTINSLTKHQLHQSA